MSQYVYLLQASGEYIKLLADDNGVIQYTVNQADFSDIETGSAGISALTGDVTATGPGSAAATLANIPTATTVAGSLLATAIAAPATPAAGKGSVYVDSTSKNIAVKDDAGVVKHGVQSATTASRFVTAISDAGAVSVATGAEAATTINTANTTTTTLVAPATSILVSGLDGDTDGDWLVYFYLLGAATTGVPKLQFNGTDDAADYCAWTQVAGASTVSGAVSAGSIALATTLGTAESSNGWIIIRTGPDTGANYNRFATGASFGPAGPTMRNFSFVTQRTANLTSMGIVCNSNSLDTGSYLSVQKLRRVYT